MKDQFSREELLIGGEALEKLRSSKVIVFGLGGVGAFAAEAIARAGVGTIVLVDGDKVSLTNLNRQLLALHSTLGRYKAEVMAERIRDINPEASVRPVNEFYTAENGARFFEEAYDYIVDAVDTVSAKLDIAVRASELGIPEISCMGAANKLDPTGFEVTDIYATSVCPLARVMRRELRKRGVAGLKVVYSGEPALTPSGEGQEDDGGMLRAKRQVPGSVSFVPPVEGFIAAGEVVKDLIGR
jgi:tRNA A37 threonylcarbamoyladenosine dehydratase